MVRATAQHGLHGSPRFWHIYGFGLLSLVTYSLFLVSRYRLPPCVSSIAQARQILQHSLSRPAPQKALPRVGNILVFAGGIERVARGDHRG